MFWRSFRLIPPKRLARFLSSLAQRTWKRHIDYYCTHGAKWTNQFKTKRSTDRQPGAAIEPATRIRRLQLLAEVREGALHGGHLRHEPRDTPLSRGEAMGGTARLLFGELEEVVGERYFFVFSLFA